MYKCLAQISQGENRELAKDSGLKAKEGAARPLLLIMLLLFLAKQKINQRL